MLVPTQNVPEMLKEPLFRAAVSNSLFNVSVLEKNVSGMIQAKNYWKQEDPVIKCLREQTNKGLYLAFINVFTSETNSPYLRMTSPLISNCTP
jgi:hypothetical protein